MHTVSQYNVSEVVWQCFWGRGTEKYGQRVVSAHGWVMMRTTLNRENMTSTVTVSCQESALSGVNPRLVLGWIQPSAAPGPLW